MNDVEIYVPWDSLVSSLTDGCRDRAKLRKLIQEIDLSVADIEFTLGLIQMLSEALMDDMPQVDEDKVVKKIDKFLAYLAKKLET